tara:strand:- start:215629 stop:216996 length:1368 start_codon:yes stop_codon:yes gene_type:complete
MTRLWGGKLRTYFAALGLGFGLGNLWRFPYVVLENGGGAFFVLYLGLAMLVALPLLISELCLGKVEKKPVLPLGEWLGGRPGGEYVFRQITKWMAWLSVFLCLFILVYYAVISGWVLHFFMQFFVGMFRSDSFDPVSIMSVLSSKGWLQVLLASVHLVIVVSLVIGLAQDKNERLVGYVMPLFMAIVLVLAYKAMSMPASSEAIRFLFYPDFSKLNLSSMAQAIGQLLFTLSIGFGAMVTFGSMMSEDSDVAGSSLRITVVDVLVSLFAGLMIFPFVMGGALDQNWGPELLFYAVPRLLADVESGTVFGALFFLCLYFAALGSSVGLLSTIVENIKGYFKISRRHAAMAIGAVCLFMSFVPVYLEAVFGAAFPFEESALKVMDNVLINWLLPLTALVISQAALYYLNADRVYDEFLKDSSPASATMYSHWRLLIRWIVPSILLFSLFLQFLDLLV